MLRISTRDLNRQIIKDSDFPTLVNLCKTDKYLRSECTEEVLRSKRCDYLLQRLEAEFSREKLKQLLSEMAQIYQLETEMVTERELITYTFTNRFVDLILEQINFEIAQLNSSEESPNKESPQTERVLFAVLKNYPNTLECLIKNFPIPYSKGIMSLAIAIKRGHLKLFEVLWNDQLRDGFFIKDMIHLLDDALDADNIQMVEKIISSPMPQSDIGTQLSIYSAISNSKPDMVRLLLKYANPHRSSALANASEEGNIPVIKALLEDKRIDSTDIIDAVERAVQKEQFEALATLISDPRFSFDELLNREDIHYDTLETIYHFQPVQDILTPELRDRFGL